MAKYWFKRYKAIAHLSRDSEELDTSNSGGPYSYVTGLWWPADQGLYIHLDADGKEAVWVGSPYPHGDDGTLSMVFGGYGIGNSTYVVTKCADEETMKLCLQLLDYGFTAEGHLYWNCGKQGVSWDNDENGEVQLPELVTNDPDTDPITKYGGQTWSGCGIQATKLLYMKNSELAIQANDLWFYENEDVTSSWKWPTGTTYTTEEQDELDIISGALGTYTAESFANFLTGALDIDDDAVWEKYIADYSNYNLDRIREIRQACYDRYMAR